MCVCVCVCVRAHSARWEAGTLLDVRLRGRRPAGEDEKAGSGGGGGGGGGGAKSILRGAAVLHASLIYQW